MTNADIRAADRVQQFRGWLKIANVWRRKELFLSSVLGVSVSRLMKVAFMCQEISSNQF